MVVVDCIAGCTGDKDKNVLGPWWSRAVSCLQISTRSATSQCYRAWQRRFPLFTATKPFICRILTINGDGGVTEVNLIKNIILLSSSENVPLYTGSHLVNMPFWCISSTLSISIYPRNDVSTLLPMRDLEPVHRGADLNFLWGGGEGSQCMRDFWDQQDRKSVV